ncbi:endonuclease/exonuclease/phosphatase family protein [Roseibacillus ishigakijimensis]|uniref:Endonuclease/exonuclease/phosphatase family protein n=1 Tax=Roseibacillus ishigakijimensis TaxID=454146 RepID=A0A934RQR7_9BACT|nr:endonuclease/exonuclease/phosphatase family protein [Roseibacillus ishigakijimensis]MBK1833728.1 endonuclease/exonuclease/phosphatase family protein [Roseibacillus ishigakijimensis]
MPRLFLALFTCLLLPLPAVPLRVVTFNIGANRDQNGDITESLNEPGSEDYEAVRAILARIDADVVCLQELANADISGGTNGGTTSDVHALAGELGLPHVLIPTNSGVFDFTLRNAILSRHPFETTDEIGSSDYLADIGAVGEDSSRAKDVTRVIPAAVIAVPGAAEPVTVLTLHAKSSTGLDDRFRRAVELARVRDYFQRHGLNEDDNLIVTGDFNLSGSSTTFTNEPAGLPSTWNRGTDLPLPLSYSNDPDFYFPAPQNLVALDARALNGEADTFMLGGAVLDFLLPSPALTTLGAEIYRSSLDTSNAQGLPKSGTPLPTETSSTASDHWAVFADFTLADAIPPATSYPLTAEAPAVSEDFADFAGQQAPPPWQSSGATWQGYFADDTAAGGYAHEEAVAFVPGEEAIVFSATFDNLTGAAISALEIGYLARQLGARSPGTTDQLQVTWSLEEGEPHNLSELTFLAGPEETLPRSETLVTTVAVEIPAGASFTLTFTATRGPDQGGEVSSAVFFNEVHYDNAGADNGEFIEVVVAPGFEAAGGDLQEVEVVFYNGSESQRRPYRTVALRDFESFAQPGESNGYRIYSHFPSDIQNGSPDGLALLVAGQVRQFLSYEGSFVALEGPAAGMASQEIAVAQDDPPPVGFGALGLTGSGADESSLSWTRFGEDVSHSPGAANAGQSFTGATPLPAQAFSLDDLQVRPVETTDRDGDGLPDEVELALGLDPGQSDSDGDGISDGEEDSDGDGQSNGAEVLIVGTDPGDANARFVAVLRRNPQQANQGELVFPTLAGRTYELLAGDEPWALESTSSLPGTGEEARLNIPWDEKGRFFAIRVHLEEGMSPSGN